jgi:N-acetylglutamate synthase-like GNAT family acetyltransferase
MATDAATSRRLLDFEIDLARRTCDEPVEADWGTAFLSPSLPQVWDASWLAIEQTGSSAEELIALGDQLLGEAGFEHRTILLCDEADGARLRPEFEALPGWEVERDLYMTWRGEGGREPATAVSELSFAEATPLRRELIRESMPAGMELLDQTVEQLLERNRRNGEAAGDRWFVAPTEPGEPASACCLLAGEGIAQVEDVGTLERARERGLGQAVVLAALAEARALEPESIFLIADATDWPQVMYAKLGFETVSELHILRRTP